MSGSLIVLPDGWKECDIYFGNVYIAKLHAGVFTASKTLYSGFYRESTVYCSASVAFDGSNTLTNGAYKANASDYTKTMELIVAYR